MGGVFRAASISAAVNFGIAAGAWVKHAGAMESSMDPTSANSFGVPRSAVADERFSIGDLGMVMECGADPKCTED